MRRESLTPNERVMRARMAAYMLHARYDPRETTKPARRAYFTRLAYLSARKRRGQRASLGRRATGY